MSGKNRREGTPRMRRSISGKTLFCILITALVLSGTSILIGYHVYANTMDQHYISNTVNLARTAVALLDADTVERCASEVYRIYSTLTPEEKPTKKLMSTERRSPATPAAARALPPAKWPTTAQSVAL